MNLLIYILLIIHFHIIFLYTFSKKFPSIQPYSIQFPTHFHKLPDLKIENKIK